MSVKNINSSDRNNLLRNFWGSKEETPSHNKSSRLYINDHGDVYLNYKNQEVRENISNQLTQFLNYPLTTPNNHTENK